MRLKYDPSKAFSTTGRASAQALPGRPSPSPKLSALSLRCDEAGARFLNPAWLEAHWTSDGSAPAPIEVFDRVIGKVEVRDGLLRLEAKVRRPHGLRQVLEEVFGEVMRGASLF